MEFRTFNDLNNIIKENLYKVQNNYDLIVGIPRSGLLPANILALYLNIPMTDFDSFLAGRIYSVGSTKKKDNWIDNIEQAERILIVEDSSVTGKSLESAKKMLEHSKYKSKCEFLTIFVTNETKEYTDMYFNVCKTPRMFEWNYIHHAGVKNACFDIDGVLCYDPTEDENDDGKKYVDFIKNARVKFVPTFEIGYIITSRLEKYRKETEEWLNNNKIKYKELIMLDLQSKEERIKKGCHGEFKGKLYKKLSDTNIFIESEINQAREIARISGKPVFCTENSEFIYGSKVYEIKNKSFARLKKYLPNCLRKILKKIIKK